MLGQSAIVRPQTYVVTVVGSVDRLQAFTCLLAGSWRHTCPVTPCEQVGGGAAAAAAAAIAAIAIPGVMPS